MKAKYNTLLSKYRNNLTEVTVVPNDFGETKGTDYILVIGNERVEISDFRFQSSSTGDSELNVTFKGPPIMLGILYISEQPKQSC